MGEKQVVHSEVPTKMKRAVFSVTALSDFDWSFWLGSNYILGLQTLRAPLHLELHLRTFVQSPVTVHLDRGEVNKHVIAVGALDEAIALGGVKPFHNTFFSHYSILLTLMLRSALDAM
jgi:hypothetical protein